MSDYLPPLTALRAFDAAARHMSFAKAAAELHVTPAALSFQIKSLEEHLGRPLFHRLNRAVELTEAGRKLAPGAAEGFSTLLAAWSATRRLQDETTLTVAAGPALTAKWLAPRLYDFAKAYPEINLRISTSLQMVDLHRNEADVAIRFGYGQYGDLYAVHARKEWLTPAMTPALAEQFPTPESLVDAPLVINEYDSFLQPPCDWPAWFKAVGINGFEPHGMQFSNVEHSIDAACAGIGVLLGRRPLLIKDVLEGRLVTPFKIAIETDARFSFVCLPGRENLAQIAAFRDWYLAEIERTSNIWGEFKIIPVKEVTVE